MFGSVGLPELILIFIIALLVFGPKKLPEIGRSMGKAMREFKKASDEVKGRLEEEIQASEFKDIHKDIQTGVNSLKESFKGIVDPSRVGAIKGEMSGMTDASTTTPPLDGAHGETTLNSGTKNLPESTQDSDKDIESVRSPEGQKVV